MEMYIYHNYDYDYKGKKYNIRFNRLNGKIKVFHNNAEYKSNYSLNDIIIKLKAEVNKFYKYEKIKSLTEKRKKFENFNIISCLKNNLIHNKLIFGVSYTNCLPSIWKIFPEDNEDNEDTFQIQLYKQTKIYKLLLIRFNKNLINEEKINDNKNQNLINEEKINDNNNKNQNLINELIINDRSNSKRDK